MGHLFEHSLRAAARSLLMPVADELVTSLLESEDPHAAWDESHHEGLHTVATMRSSVAQHFSIRESTRVPYLYRYLVPVLPETPSAGQFLEDVLREEASAIAGQQIVAIGWRLVGMRIDRPGERGTA